MTLSEQASVKKGPVCTLDHATFLKIKQDFRDSVYNNAGDFFEKAKNLKAEFFNKPGNNFVDLEATTTVEWSGAMPNFTLVYRTRLEGDDVLID